MSQQVVITDTVEAYPSGFDSTNSVYDSVNSSYPIENGYASATNTNYAQINITTGASAETWIYYTFAPNIPTGSTITSISCQALASLNNISSKRIAVRQIRMYTGTTGKGTAQNLTTTDTTFTFTESVSDWTVSQLNNARIVMHVQRNTNDTSQTYYVRFYGATLTIGYTFEGIAYEITSSSNIPNTKGVSISPEYQLQPSAASITITNEDGLNLRVIDTYGVSKTTQTFNDTSYTYTLSNLNNDHNVVVDYNTTNYSKINSQWRPIIGVYQKSSGVWSATTFNSAFPSGTMIKQGNDISDEVPLVKFLSNCDVIYLDGYSSSKTSTSISRRYTPADDINLDGKTCYVLVFFGENFGLHKVEFHIPSDSMPTTTATSLLQCGDIGGKLYVSNGQYWTSYRTTLYPSASGQSAISVYGGTMVTLKLKDSISSAEAQQLETLVSTNSNILYSNGRNSASTDFLPGTFGGSRSYYILVACSTTFGLSKVTEDKTIIPILGYTTSSTITNRSMICTDNNNIYYSGPTSVIKTLVPGGGTFVYL